MNKVILTALFLMLSFVSFCKSYEADELTYLAVNETGAERAELLISAIDKNPDSPTVALNLLLNTSLNGRQLNAAAKKYDAVWKKYPGNPDIVSGGIILFRRAKKTTSEILANLKAADRYFYASGEDNLKIHDINCLRLTFHIVCGDVADGAKFAAQLTPEKYISELCVFYNIALFRAKVAGNVKDIEFYGKKYQQMMNTDIALMPQNITFHDLARKMIVLLQNGAVEHAEMILDFWLSKNGNSKQTDTLRALYAVYSPDFNRVSSEVAKIRDKQLAKEKNNYLFAAALNAKNWNAAEKMIEKFAPQQRGEKSFELAAARLDGKVLAEAGNDMKYDFRRRASYKFMAAGVLADKKLFYEAKELLKNHRLSVDELNMIAYTAVELGIELDDAYATLLRVIKIAPDNAAYLDSFAYVCYRKGLYAQADKYIRLALDRVRQTHGPAVILEHAGGGYRSGSGGFLPGGNTL